MKPLTRQQQDVLAAVHRLGPVTVREVAEHLAIARSSTQTCLRSLVKDGVLRAAGTAPGGGTTFAAQTDTKESHP